MNRHQHEHSQRQQQPGIGGPHELQGTVGFRLRREHSSVPHQGGDRAGQQQRRGIPPSEPRLSSRAVQDQAEDFADDRRVDRRETQPAQSPVQRGQAVEVGQKTLADAEDHQQGETVDLHVAQGALPGRHQMDQLFAVGRPQCRRQVNGLIHRLDQEPGQRAENVIVVNGERFAGPSPGGDDDPDEQGDGRHLQHRAGNRPRPGPGDGAGQRFQDGAGDQANEQEDQAGPGETRPSQGCVFEAREGLVGEAHHEQSHPAEDLSMTVGVDFVQAGRPERAGEGNPQEQVGAPDRPQRQRNRDAGLEEGPINGIGQGRSFLRRRRRGRLARGRADLVQQPRQGDFMGASEELQRFGRPHGSAAAAQPVAVEYRPHLRSGAEQIGDSGCGHRSTPGKNAS